MFLKSPRDVNIVQTRLRLTKLLCKQAQATLLNVKQLTKIIINPYECFKLHFHGTDFLSSILRVKDSALSSETYFLRQTRSEFVNKMDEMKYLSFIFAKI